MKNKIIGINIDAQLAEEVKRRAKTMNLSTSTYCKIILMNWINSGDKLEIMEK